MAVHTDLAIAIQVIQQHVIARELVLLANTLAGRYCRDAALPALYRAEEAPSAVLGDPEHFDPVAAYRQKRLMPRATLQTTPAPHAGVGAAAYVPITGACRRYTDLLMHRQLLGCLADGQAPLTPEALEHALLRTATARLAQQEITANAQRYWLLRDLEGRVGEALPAVVLERFTAGALVELTATRLHVYCPAAALPPGAPLTVRVEHVSAPADVVRVRVSP